MLPDIETEWAKIYVIYFGIFNRFSYMYKIWACET